MPISPDQKYSDLHATIMKFPSDWHLDAHSHPQRHELLVIIDGAIQTQIRGKVINGQVGNVLYYPKGEVHEEDADSPEGLRMLFFSWSGEPEIDAVNYPILGIDRTGRLQTLARWLLDLSPATNDEVEHMRFTILEAMLFEFKRTRITPDDEMILRVKRHIQDHLAEQIRLEDLAEKVGLTKFHFARAFRKATGESPMRFVRQARVDAARALIQNSDTPLHKIAPLVGFADEFQLSRIFRRMTGVTPSSLRQDKG